MSPTFDRRTLLLAAAAVPLAPRTSSTATSASPSDLDPARRPPASWFAGRGCGNQAGPRNLPQDAAADRILCETRRPRIPRRTFLATDYGAVGDGVTDNTKAIADTIAAASRHGGGRVVLPADPSTGTATYFTGPIHLQSRIELHVPAGVTVLFSTDPTVYPLVYTRWQGIECYNYSPNVYAYGATDIAITGDGTLNAQASTGNWWAWKSLETPGWNVLQAYADDDVPVAQRVMGAGYYLPPTMIEPYNCERVLLQGVTFVNSPFWHLHPTLSQDVIIEGVTVGPTTGPNTDGIDPESCTRVVIDHCSISAGDDCMAIKAGRNADGRRVNVPCTDLVIQNTQCANGHGGVTIGSEMTGGVAHVYGRDLVLSSTGLQAGHRLKTNSVRGGFIEDSNIFRVSAPIIGGPALVIDYTYGEGDTGMYYPTVTDINLLYWNVGSATAAWDVIGYTEDHVGTVLLQDFTVTTMTGTNTLEFIDDLELVDVTINGAAVTSG
ncbi:MAG TPA: glycoside hydrolase family 28 protein [Actinospica sp.]|jgi:polygalacturonase|nr:glycoside hydrolase family 28 protein [Actinospica sp.]